MLRSSVPGFRAVPKTGVIYVMHKAAQLGYTAADETWANLGQGSPETGSLPGAPPRIEQIVMDPSSHKYAPVEGQIALRQAVADFYNAIYRQGKSSQYTYENVSIAGGGRAALTRLAAALGNVNMGHFLPDYTAYEELLSAFHSFVPIPILLSGSGGFKISTEELRREILGRGLTAVLASNPCNPTGQVISSSELAQWVEIARELGCTFILDEFYSHFLYEQDAGGNNMLSAAAHVEDVNEDPVILVDGLTKNWRYPGWRVSWTVGPKEIIEIVASAGSFLDGGANNPFQEQVIPLLHPALVRQETAAIQRHFRLKRDYMLARLRSMGIAVEAEPEGTFYCWANLAHLPAPLNDGLTFFKEGLGEKVITVPGIFFDVNPERRRSHARYQSYARISFGPEMEILERGLDAMERLIGRIAGRTLLPALNGTQAADS